MKVVVIGGGIGGLTLALALHKVGVECRVYEAVDELRPLGVGLNLLPHAMRDLTQLGVAAELERKGIVTKEICFYTRHGQLVDREPRGRYAGYEWPQVSIHRGDLHETLRRAVKERLGSDAVVLGHRCTEVVDEGSSVQVRFVDPRGHSLPPVQGGVAIACDGLHSAVRTQLHPVETRLRHENTTQWRGVTRWKPFLTGASMVYAGTNSTGKLVCYPIRDRIDAASRQLINWVIELERPADEGAVRDWERRGRVEDFIERFADWRFDWLDVAGMLRAADSILEYPMVDQEPLEWWGTGRVTLLGDAAHPMTPRGSNGAAQAIIDALVIAPLLRDASDPADALRAYEAKRVQATSAIVLANRTQSPDAILRVVEERTGGKPFDRIENVISRDELNGWQERYKKVAGFHRDSLRRTQ